VACSYRIATSTAILCIIENFQKMSPFEIFLQSEREQTNCLGTFYWDRTGAIRLVVRDFAQVDFQEKSDANRLCE